MERLSQFCSSLRYNDLPAVCKERAKVLIADSVANMISGLILPIGSVLQSYAFEIGGNPECRFVGGRRIPSPLAVFAHSSMASATQWDDTHNRSVTHISSAVVPAALAVCEREGLGGKKLIESVVIGAEVMARVGMTLGPRELYAKGFHPSSLCGPFGAAAASGKAFGFTQNQFFQAFGLAAVQASGLLCGSEKGPTSWYIQYGKGAECGVLASRLVRLGASAPQNMFTDFRGFFKVFSDNPKLSWLTKNLGKAFAVEEISQKRYPCFQFGQSVLEAFFQLRRKHSFSSTDIARIVVHIPSAAPKEIFLGAKFDFPPKTVLSAQTDLRFLLGFAATFSEVTLDRLIRDRENPSVKAVAGRVSVKGEAELNKHFPATWPGRIEIYLKGRRSLSHSVSYPKGDWRNPMTWEELHEKFTEIVERKSGRDGSKRIWSQLIHLDELPTLENLLPRRIHGK